MFNPLSMIAPYDGALAFINSLDVYKTYEGSDELLDLVRELQFSGNYYWQGIAIPDRAHTSVLPQVTINGSLQLPSGTYITSITHYNDVTNNPEGYKIKIWDKGTKNSLFYGDYCLERLVSSNMQLLYGSNVANPPTDVGSNTDTPFGQAYFTSPFIITDPGVLGWEIVNLSVNTATIQLMLAAAVPINKKSVNQLVVDRTT
jgi:hypothetical protein